MKKAERVYTKPTTYDIATQFDKAVEALKKAGVDTENITFWLPDGMHGPMPIEKAKEICKAYWKIK